MLRHSRESSTNGISSSNPVHSYPVANIGQDTPDGADSSDDTTSPIKQPLLSDLSAAPCRKRTSAGRRRARSVWNYLHYDDIPDWMRDNDLIRLYYRPQMTFKQAAVTLFSLHNETVNIWTHIIGLFCMISLSVFWWQEPLPVALDSRGRPCAQQGDPAQPKWPMFVFLVCAFYTFGISSFAHLFHVVSKDMMALVWRLDHMGIAVGCTGGFFPICIYAFSCDNRLLAPIYLTITCITAMMVMACSMLDVFHTMAFRPYRLAIQLSFAVWSQMPMLHALMHVNPHEQPTQGLVKVYLAIAVVTVGGVIYAMRVTEKLFTHYVDLIGSSHNIMHCTVVLAHLLLFSGAHQLWLWRNTAGACTPPVCGM